MEEVKQESTGKKVVKGVFKVIYKIISAVKDNVKETRYNLGLYKIVKTEEQGKMKTMLKPFFLD